MSSQGGRTLTEALEFLQGEAELAEDLVEEGRSDLSATINPLRHMPLVARGAIPRRLRRYGTLTACVKLRRLIAAVVK